jgi:hypothetical protein
MFAALPLDPRIAFLLLAALIIGAAVPLAIGWARLLPEEKPPFELENPWHRTARPLASIYDSEPVPQKIDLGAIILLVLLTVAFALQFPGVPREPALNSLPDHVPDAQNWFEIALPCLLILVSVVAILHGAVRRSFLRWQLIVGGSLVLLLWIVAQWLYGALAAA